MIRYFSTPENPIWVKLDWRSFSPRVWRNWVFIKTEENFPLFLRETAEVVRDEMYRIICQLTEDAPEDGFKGELPYQYQTEIGGIFISLYKNTFLGEDSGFYLYCAPHFDHHFMFNDLEAAQRKSIHMVKEIVKQQYNHFFPLQFKYEFVTMKEYCVDKESRNLKLLNELQNDVMKEIQNKLEFTPILFAEISKKERLQSLINFSPGYSHRL